MRKPLIAGNWKMNTTVSESVQLISGMQNELSGISGVECVLCPPFISLKYAHDLIKDKPIYLGAQNMYFKEKGAFTGEISPLMLQGMCKYVILGHSERRQYFGETDTMVNEKVKVALSYHLFPIMCIGESLQENEANQTREVLKRQVTNGLKAMQATPELVLAYEPIWAIGTGKAATSQQAGDTIGFIRQLLLSHWGGEQAASIRILYGGSVTGANISELMDQTEIDGALVGGASLKPAEFISIVRLAAVSRLKK